MNNPFLGNCDPKKEFLQMILIGVFVTLFLAFFQPFGLSTYDGNIYGLASLFGLTTFIAGYAYFLFTTFILKFRQDLPSWKFWKWIIYVSLLLVFVAAGNYLLMYIISKGSLDLTPGIFWKFLVNTFAIGIFPIGLSGLISIHRNEYVFNQEASLLPVEKYHATHNVHSETINIPSRYDEEFSIKSSDIYFIEAEDNYVAINYTDHEKDSKELIRNSISEIEKYLHSEQFLRCHRSYIVNLDKVEKASGNAQGLILSLEGTNLTVPVSRQYVKALKEKVIN